MNSCFADSVFQNWFFFLCHLILPKDITCWMFTQLCLKKKKKKKKCIYRCLVIFQWCEFRLTCLSLSCYGKVNLCFISLKFIVHILDSNVVIWECLYHNNQLPKKKKKVDYLFASIFALTWNQNILCIVLPSFFSSIFKAVKLFFICFLSKCTIGLHNFKTVMFINIGIFSLLRLLLWST